MVIAKLTTGSIDTLPQSIDNTEETMDDVADVIQDAIGGELLRQPHLSTSPLGLIRCTVFGAVAGMIDAGEATRRGARGILMGVVRGFRRRRGYALDVIRLTSREIVAQATSAGRDAAQAAQGVIEGAIHLAAEMSVTTKDAAAAAVIGALHAAGGCNDGAFEAVRGVVLQQLSPMESSIDHQGPTQRFARVEQGGPPRTRRRRRRVSVDEAVGRFRA